MPPARQATPVQALREAARSFVDATSLRQAARDIGMSPTGLRGFLDGAAPYVKTERKLMAWYLREGAQQFQAVSPDAAQTAMRLLVGHFAVQQASEAALEVLDVVERRCRAAQAPVPGWVPELRDRFSN